MKKIKINKVLTGLGALLVMTSLSSCLKNGAYYTDFSTPAGSIYLPLAATNNNSVVAFSYDASLAQATMPIVVDVASPNTPSTQTTATIAIDADYLTSYNTANGTDFEVMPDSVYTLSKMDMTVPAGKRIDSAIATFYIPKMDLTHNYVLPITISNASLPIEQWNHLLLYIAVKNKYDGVYQVTGTMVDAANAGLTGYYPWTVELVTSGPNSVVLTDPTNGPIHLILSGGSLSYYGGFGVIFNFDPSGSGKVNSVVNYYGNPSSAGNTRSGSIDPTGVNKWDPSTKNMDVSYFMTQPSVITTPPYVRTSFTEHYKYLHPR
ncbi:MAG TPA: DUF1735 domain-containing protein [Chitinophagaceae bacterium]|nr:DUF1735 domain-containing protein [Chitinophagaceae bacterium]